MRLKLSWSPNTVYSLRLRDGLFCLAQMRQNHIMQFFKVRSTSGRWPEIDLGTVPSLFFAFVAEQRLRPLIEQQLSADQVRYSSEAVPRVMLSSVYLGPNKFSARLVELTEDYDSYPLTVLKESLSAETDQKLIHEHELVGMIGDAEKLRARLLRYFETGVNWDDAKSFLFKQMPLPAPEGQYNL